MIDLAKFLPANIFAVMLVFTRIGAAMMLLPGFGDLYVPQRYRLLLALFISVLIASTLSDELPALPSSPTHLVVLLAGEIIIGLFVGTVGRILLNALETAGTITSYQLGLSSAQVFNPLLQQSGALTSAFLTMLGSLIIFLTDTHHLLLRALIGTYAVFPAGVFPATGDLSDGISRVVASSFGLAVELAAPFIVIGTLFFVALGLLSRLMPQLQVFFVILPVQIAGGMLVFAFTLYAIMNWFLDGFVQRLGSLVPLQ